MRQAQYGTRRPTRIEQHNLDKLGNVWHLPFPGCSQNESTIVVELGLETCCICLAFGLIHRHDYFELRADSLPPDLQRR